MLRSWSEVLLGLLLILAAGEASEKLAELRLELQLLQAEMERLYVEQPPRPETQLVLEDLQSREHQLVLLIDNLQRTGSVPRLAINLTADFENLQHKLDDLKHQLERLDGRFASQTKQLEAEHTPAPAPAAPSPGLGSFLWGPLLTMPEFPQGNVAGDHQHQHPINTHHQQDQPQQPETGNPSIIKRVLDMLRPSVGVAGLRSRWAESDKSVGSVGTLGKTASSPPSVRQPLSAEELLPQLQEQRRFLDDAITRLELLAAKNKFKKA
ncbi:uncharacterized protein Dana_GF21934 [Drosophila ananassae]|uniref:Uncharacterized protein n=1 Tax=Drosophila ananassae TaxID=7217 RepID=B3MYY6_DROAN|nr:uncharacterized protein LOC6504604 [Drosophila ananassae]EDV32830.1 uncharacterized protein Dana_GF21934 [Drosophila ananassae]